MPHSGPYINNRKSQGRQIRELISFFPKVFLSLSVLVTATVEPPASGGHTGGRSSMLAHHICITRPVVTTHGRHDALRRSRPRTTQNKQRPGAF